MMDSDEALAGDAEPFTPKLPRLTAWRTPPPTAYVPPPPEPEPSRRRQWLAGGGIALTAFMAGAFVLLRVPNADHLPVAASAADQRKAEARRLKLVASYDPISLPSGLSVDRSSAMNYDLAAWLAPAPLSARTFTFDRIGFAPGSAALAEDDRDALQVLSQILAAYPQARATITGNGPGPLGLARADAIRNALLQLAADPDQLSVAPGDASDDPPKFTVKRDLGVASDLDA